MSTACANSMTSPLSAAAQATCPPPAGASGLSIVIPCHNEAQSLANLASAMVRLRAALAGQYQVEFLLVDDGSTDATWQLMHDFFYGQTDVRLLRHDVNRGLAAAIATGLRQARAEIVASLDADCTYDPLQLVPMLALLGDGVDLVVASPYHPQGAALGIPRWRLALSQSASRLYRAVMHNKLHTYTSCVRVYRRSSVIDLPPTSNGFAGVAELLWQLDRRGGKVLECPTVLTVRQTGRSKMRIARTALAHLRLLARAAWLRLMGHQSSPLHSTGVVPLKEYS
jgi:dolichol-phosphate mannosyltransferase